MAYDPRAVLNTTNKHQVYGLSWLYGCVGNVQAIYWALHPDYDFLC